MLLLNETKQAGGSCYSGKLTYRLGNDKNGVSRPEQEKSTQKIEIIRELPEKSRPSDSKKEPKIPLTGRDYLRIGLKPQAHHFVKVNVSFKDNNLIPPKTIIRVKSGTLVRPHLVRNESAKRLERERASIIAKWQVKPAPSQQISRDISLEARSVKIGTRSSCRLDPFQLSRMGSPETSTVVPSRLPEKKSQAEVYQEEVRRVSQFPSLAQNRSLKIISKQSKSVADLNQVNGYKRPLVPSSLMNLVKQNLTKGKYTARRKESPVNIQSTYFQLPKQKKTKRREVSQDIKRMKRGNSRFMNKGERRFIRRASIKHEPWISSGGFEHFTQSYYQNNFRLSSMSKEQIESPGLRIKQKAMLSLLLRKDSEKKIGK